VLKIKPTWLKGSKQRERENYKVLDKMAKLSDSEPLDIFLTSEFLLKSKV